jgi:hypothetical protein
VGTVEVNFRNMPDDAMVEVPPHGMFQNHTTVEVEGLDEDLVVGDTHTEGVNEASNVDLVFDMTPDVVDGEVVDEEDSNA